MIGINCRPNMSTKPNTRTNRPLPADYNKINDLDMSPNRGSRRKRRNYTKLFGFICVILLGILIVCSYYLFQKDYTCVSRNEKKCHATNCIISAAYILNNLNTNINPCNDFYEYSGDLIESLNADKQRKYIQKLIMYYNSCLNEDLIGELDIKPLTKIVDELGGWPVVGWPVSKWPQEGHRFNWINTYVMMRKIGLITNSLISIRVEKDVRNGSRFIAQIAGPEFGLNIENADQSKQYSDLMMEMAEMMGADKSDARNDLYRVFMFEKELISFSLSPKNQQNTTHYNTNNYMTIRQIEKLSPNIDWFQLLTEFTNIPGQFKHNITYDTEVLVRVRPYIQRLNQKLSTTDSRIGFPQELLDENQMDNWLTNRDVNPADIIFTYKPEDNTFFISDLVINGLYKEDVPKALNYGQFGVLIAQQMLKVLDNTNPYNDRDGYGQGWDRESDNLI
ncbi:unnamed protein product [Medioppia subpectinata]|uniref:Peptidase M13 N-terminal domain-containing protein n=1 Tax=Medioppia subpectinata TaxID=1979941 RepID=A0A7R9KUC2_9ACAR|nr:unnamed protein product [Medioppia subpectinata]CAG2109644.1 unnamed protein product [Medioppia subpectinata]